MPLHLNLSLLQPLESPFHYQPVKNKRSSAARISSNRTKLRSDNPSGRTSPRAEPLTHNRREPPAAKSDEASGPSPALSASCSPPQPRRSRPRCAMPPEAAVKPARSFSVGRSKTNLYVPRITFRVCIRRPASFAPALSSALAGMVMSGLRARR